MRLAAQFRATRSRGRRELDQLTGSTAFTRDELKLLYWGWKCSCLSGSLTESTFKGDTSAAFFSPLSHSSPPSLTSQIYTLSSSHKQVSDFPCLHLRVTLPPETGDSSLYAHHVYRAMFSEKAAADVNFTDYAKALSTLCRGSTQDKLLWTFKVRSPSGKVILLLTKCSHAAL